MTRKSTHIAIAAGKKTTVQALIDLTPSLLCKHKNSGNSPVLREDLVSVLLVELHNVAGREQRPLRPLALGRRDHGRDEAARRGAGDDVKIVHQARVRPIQPLQHHKHNTSQRFVELHRTAISPTLALATKRGYVVDMVKDGNRRAWKLARCEDWRMRLTYLELGFELGEDGGRDEPAHAAAVHTQNGHALPDAPLGLLPHEPPHGWRSDLAHRQAN
jgi:hypothetical protein